MSDWISVKDGIPESGDWVLVCYGGNLVEQGYLRLGKWFLSRTDGYDEVIQVYPTHWMPLPEPPK